MTNTNDKPASTHSGRSELRAFVAGFGAAGAFALAIGVVVVDHQRAHAYADGSICEIAAGRTAEHQRSGLEVDELDIDTLRGNCRSYRLERHLENLGLDQRR